MRLVVDIEPLRRYPQFRWLWSGYLVSQIGSQLSRVAVMYQVFRLTNSSLIVGLVSLAQLVPSIAGSILGGTLADVVDRRRLLLVSQLSMAAAALGLAINTSMSSPSLAVIFVLSALTAAFNGADSPTRTALMMTLVDRSMIPKANALRQIIQQSSQVVGPGVAGILLATTSVGSVYAIDTVSFFASITAVLVLKKPRPMDGKPRLGFAAVAEGFRFLRTRPAIQGCFVADLSATVFGTPDSLFPALGIDKFHGGAQAVGFLSAAGGVGALIATMLAGWTPHVKLPGQAVLIATAVWGLAIAGFGFSAWLPLALVLLAVAGAADVLSSVFRGTILQLEAPDRLRGRLSAIHSSVVQGGPKLGNAEAGGVAALGGNTFSVVSGGLACVIGSFLIARAMPTFARYRLHLTDEPAQVH